ncbi:EAL and GGDEF domain-containing protein [Thiohalorhabdus sp. Cl-TMA]|uniref:EAL domain-containing protein n=1 Tax=Thiohalorhabdus methylotrophus TaxID=3242694 RepID=A0ABV4TUM2_9GAMM
MVQDSRSPAWRIFAMVAGGYLLFGLLWILLSDWAVQMLAPDRAALAQLQSYKGMAYVVLSTGLILGLLAREVRHREAKDRYWQDIIDLAQEGFWLIDAGGRTRAVNQSMAALLGYRAEEMHGRTPFEFATPQGREVFAEQLGQGRDQGLRHTRAEPRQYEVTLQTRAGEPVPVLVHATALRDDAGRVTGSFAFMTDLSDIRARQRELDLSRHAVENSFDEIYRISPDGRLLDANHTACENLGYSLRELMGLTVADVDPNFSAADWRAHWSSLKARGHLALETTHRTREGIDYPVEVGVIYLAYEEEEFAYAIARDISERKAAEESSRRADYALRALSRANAALIHATDEAVLFQEVCQALTNGKGYPLAWVGLAEGDPQRTVRVAGAAGREQAYLKEITVGWGDDAAGQGPTGNAIRTGERQVLRNLEGSPDYDRWREAAHRHRFQASAALPIFREDRPIGALNVYSTDATAFDAREIALLEELAADLGFGVQTLQVRAERDRQMGELRLAGAVFDSSAEGILVTDLELRIEKVNRAFTRITGYEADEVLGHTPDLLRSGLHDEAFYEALWADIENQGHWQGEIWGRRKNGELYPKWLTLSEVRDESGTLTNYVAVFADITQAHQTQEELTFRTYHDPLTGLPNRALFRERLEHALESGQRRMALVLIDLQGFRALNDSFGAEGGDEVLRRTAERLQAVLRHQDTVARPGADEFWVLLEDLPRHHALERWLTTLMEALSMPLSIGEQTVRLEANMGVALAPEDGTDLDPLLTNAATALHRAQREGHGQIHYFQPEMHQTVQRRVRLEEALKVAIDQEELRVCYQPQVDLESGAIDGLEALVRWHHPEWGLVSPGEFIPIAEETGLVVQIGDWVLEQALAQLACWRSKGYPLRRVSVNVAAAQLQREDWPRYVAAVLGRTGVPAQCLELEITEEGVLASLEETAETMTRLKGLDIRLAIDDFGTGYSSLAYLKQLPVDTLKVDKAFIDGLPGVEHDRSITEAILAVAGTLGLDVVPEGVEEEAQARWLREKGVRLAQGFLFHRPQDPEQLAPHLNGVHPDG